MKISAVAAFGVLAMVAATSARAGYVGFDSLTAGTIVTNQFASQWIIPSPAAPGVSVSLPALET